MRQFATLLYNHNTPVNTLYSGPQKDQKADKRTNGRLEPKNLLSPDQISSIFFPLKGHKFCSSPRCNLSNFKVLKIISHHWKWDIFKANIAVVYIYLLYILGISSTALMSVYRMDIKT